MTSCGRRRCSSRSYRRLQGCVRPWHIAEQVFLELAREIEAQSVGQKVAADMFGLALRSYQVKLKRVSESADAAPVSLWQDIHARLAVASATRPRAGARLSHKRSQGRRRRAARHG